MKETDKKKIKKGNKIFADIKKAVKKLKKP